MNDTSPEIEKRLSAMYASRTPAERLRMASSMFETAKKLVEAGLLNEQPGLTRPQIRARTFLRLYGDCFSSGDIKRIVREIPDMQLDEEIS
jgi:hypothetical protein